MKLLTIVLTAFAIIAFGIWDWRRAIKAALVLAVVEGALRKWLMPGFNEFIYFLKDVVLLGAYIGFLMRGDRLQISGFPRLSDLVICVSVGIGFQALNPSLGSVTVGLFGVNTYLMYVPLCFLISSLFPTAADLKSFLGKYLLLIVPVGLIGCLQFWSPPDSFWNRYANSADPLDVITFGDSGQHARITGTFPFISGLTAYLTVVAPLVLAFLAQTRDRLWYLLGIPEAILVVACLLMSGSRAPTLIVATMALCFLLGGGLRFSRHSLGFGLAVGAAALAALLWFPQALSAFRDRAESSDESFIGRVFQHRESLEEYISDAGLSGYGAGATHPGSQALRNALGLSNASEQAIPAEAEYVRVAQELGVALALLWYAIRIYLIWALLRTYLLVRESFLRHLALAVLLLHAFSLNGSIVLNHTMGILYWFLAGFIFLLPKLDATLAVVAHQPGPARRFTRILRKRPAVAL